MLLAQRLQHEVQQPCYNRYDSLHKPCVPLMRLSSAGQFGCPQTRDRLIVMSTLNGLTPVELPSTRPHSVSTQLTHHIVRVAAETHAKYKEDEEMLVKAFDTNNTAFPCLVRSTTSLVFSDVCCSVCPA